MAEIGAIIVIFLWNSIFEMNSVFYMAECIILAVYLVGVEVPGYLIQEKENKIYKELLMYFSRVKHRYTAGKNIANAIIDGADGMMYEIQCMAEDLYRMLMECDRKDKVREYISSHNVNRYSNLFFIQVYEASEKGNTYFAENIEHLRLDLMEEIYRRKQRRHEFAGYTFVTVLPFFFMPLLKTWGLAFTPELEVFYAGTGLVLETVTFIVSILIYGIISGAKELVISGENKNKQWNAGFLSEFPAIENTIRRIEMSKGSFSKAMRRLILSSGERISYGRLCLKMIFIAVSSWILLTCFLLGKQESERNAILERVEAIEMIAPVASKEKQQILAEHILAVTKECVQRKETKEGEIRKLLQKKIRLGNESTEQAVVSEIQRKLAQYRKTKILPGEVFACALCGVIISFFPVFILYYRRKTIFAGADYEVRQMQSVILMERKICGITVIGLLEDMEVFACSFQRCLRRCIDSYGMGNKAALLRLKEEGRRIHENFEELADAFLSVDDVGIELAFDEIESNRRLLEKMDGLETDINLARKKDSTDLLARIPAAVAVGAYFIVPFFVYSLQGVFEVFDLLENLYL